MKVTANISGLDTTKLGAPLRQALMDALRARVTSMPRWERAPDATAVREVDTPNAPPRLPP
jgi:hypothetical protein